jgi:hypothetical protein
MSPVQINLKQNEREHEIGKPSVKGRGERRATPGHALRHTPFEPGITTPQDVPPTGDRMSKFK